MILIVNYLIKRPVDQDPIVCVEFKLDQAVEDRRGEDESQNWQRHDDVLLDMVGIDCVQDDEVTRMSWPLFSNLFTKHFLFQQKNLPGHNNYKS